MLRILTSLGSLTPQGALHARERRDFAQAIACLVCTHRQAFFALWQILAGLSLMNCLVGLVAALVATWTSLRLMPAGQWRFRPFKLARYALRFLRQSIVAGVDVAWRALHPSMPLQPGFVVFRPKLPACSTLDAFCTVSSLLPGTLPSGPDVSGGLSIHCLDVSQPVARQLAEEEALFVGCLGERRGDD